VDLSLERVDPEEDLAAPLIAAFRRVAASIRRYDKQMLRLLM
jgi:hypothetical protein